MRTSVFFAPLISLGLVYISWAADINLKNFNSSADLVEEHDHIHLGNDKAGNNHDNETYVTENPHKHHDRTSTTEHKHETSEFQNTEPDITAFFRAASEGAVYDETSEKKHDHPHDAHDIHLHHAATDGDDRDSTKLLRSQAGGSSYVERPMEHPMETDHNTGHVMLPSHEMETDHNTGHVMHPSHEMNTMEQQHDKQHDGHDDHDHHTKMDMNNTGSMHDMMMMMYFHTGVNEIVLFKQWKITTVGGLIGSMIGIFLLAMIYEGLKYFREHLFKKYVSSIQFSTVAVTGESGRVTQVHRVERHHMMSWPHALQTLLHVVQIIMSYFLMLIFMTYNVWLCIAVVLGAGVGYFIFGWKKASVVDITEHCH